MPSESHLRDWIQHCRESYEETTRVREAGGGVTDSPQIDKGLGRDAGAIGFAKLALGESEDAHEWLRRAADHYDAALEQSVGAAEEDPSSALVPWSWLATCYAYLVDDADLLHTVLDRVADAPPRYPDLYPEHAVRLYQLLAFRALLQGDETATREHLDEFHRYAEAHDADDSFARVVEGLLDGEAEEIAAGIEAMCEHHYDWIEADPDHRAPGEGIALNALVLLTLATERGYDIAVEHEGLLDPPAWKTDK